MLARRERERPTASARNGPRSLVRGCPENADADSATLALPSTEPRMKRAAIGHSLPVPLAALCRSRFCAVEAGSQFSSLGVDGQPVMERSVLLIREPEVGSKDQRKCEQV